VFAQADEGTAVNAVSDTGIAVVGESIHGVAGVFAAGPAGAARAEAPPGRAAVFFSDSAAQVRLVPHKAGAPLPPSQNFTPQPFIPKGVELDLPAKAQPGDLLCTMKLRRPPQVTPQVEVASLWFCETGGNSQDNPATWRQVLLGPGFFGQR
jgi:hypothetical protein